jgi:hypothetical protein
MNWKTIPAMMVGVSPSVASSRREGPGMASGDDPCPEHRELTRSGFRYCFYMAHHGRGTPDDSQWAEDVSRDEEFAIFDESDEHELSDSKGHYYGLRRSPEGDTLDLGTKREQIAKFWDPVKNQPAHGFPMWPVHDGAPDNRKKQSIPLEVLKKMLEQKLLLSVQYNRLRKGNRA